jgi:hypothetical protein
MIGWLLAGCVAVALMVVGGRALVAPRPSLVQYGLATTDPRALGLVRAMGIRDVVIGILLALLALERSRGVLGWAMFAAALVAFVDFAVVMTERGAGTVPDDAARGFDRSCWIHAAGATGLLLTGIALRAGL